MAATASTFTCDGCKRKFPWKQELAGKKVRCKCGQPLRVPGGNKDGGPAAAAPLANVASRKTARPAPVDASGNEPVGLDAEGLYALVAEAESAARNQAGVIREVAAAPVMPLAHAAPPRVMGASPLSYRSGPTRRELARAEADTLLDMTRDVYVPLSMMAAGMLIYDGFYVAHYPMSTPVLVGFTIGLSIMAAIQTAVLFGLALLLAGPLSIGFGDARTAILKFAGIVVLSDAVTVWAESFMVHITGGLGATLLSRPFGLIVYVTAFVYLFGLETSEALTAAVVIRVLDVILSWILLAIFVAVVFGAILGTAGKAFGTLGGPMVAAHAHRTYSPDPLSDHVAALQGANLLEEGRAFSKRRETYMVDVVTNLYTHGAKHVWYEVSRDINMHAYPQRVIVELPDTNAERSRCYRDVKDFYDTNKQIDYDPADLVDKGAQYLAVQM